jgi:prepilin-type N-terminal cleavage/methylation domain-containing protein
VPGAMIARLRSTIASRLRDQRGFSLTELLVAITIGMVVLMAAWMVLDRTITASGQIADRSEALQRGRQAMDLISRQLRSQVCVGTTTPIVSGSDLSVSFYADLTDGTPLNPIKKRTLTYSAVTDTISESIAPSTGTYPALTFGTATTTPLLTKVKQILESDGTTLRPIFRFYGYQANTTNGSLVPLSSPLSATDLKRVAVIKVGFRSFAARPISNDKDSTNLENDVYIRTAVPTELQGQPECI